LRALRKTVKRRLAELVFKRFCFINDVLPDCPKATNATQAKNNKSDFLHRHLSVNRRSCSAFIEQILHHFYPRSPNGIGFYHKLEKALHGINLIWCRLKHHNKSFYIKIQPCFWVEYNFGIEY